MAILSYRSRMRTEKNLKDWLLREWFEKNSGIFHWVGGKHTGLEILCRVYLRPKGEK